MTYFCHNFMQPYVVSRGLDQPGTNRGFFSHTVSVQRLPTEPIGYSSITLVGVHAGCEVRIRDKDTNELAGVESCVEDPSFILDVRSIGSPYNTVRIVVISTDYELIDLQYTISVGSFSIPIEMREDPWFKDPV